MKCTKCKSALIWQNDFDYSDYDVKGDGIVSVHLCSECSTLYNFYLSGNCEIERVEIFDLEDDEE